MSASVELELEHSKVKEAIPPMHDSELELRWWSLGMNALRMTHRHAQGRGHRQVLHLQDSETQQ